MTRTTAGKSLKLLLAVSAHKMEKIIGLGSLFLDSRGCYISMYKRFRTACTIYQAPFKGLSLLITLAIYLSLPVNNAMNFHWAQECQTLWVQDKRKCSHYSRRISMLPRTEDWIMLISHAPRSLKPNLVSRVWVTDRDGPRGTTKSSDKNKQTKNQQNRHIKIAAEHAPPSPFFTNLSLKK